MMIDSRKLKLALIFHLFIRCSDGGTLIDNLSSELNELKEKVRAQQEQMAKLKNNANTQHPGISKKVLDSQLNTLNIIAAITDPQDKLAKLKECVIDLKNSLLQHSRNHRAAYTLFQDTEDRLMNLETRMKKREDIWKDFKKDFAKMALGVSTLAGKIEEYRELIQYQIQNLKKKPRK